MAEVVILCPPEGSETLIPVTSQPQPANFEATVGIPGRDFLRRNPTPATFKGSEFWKLCLDDLRTAYRGICAYCCLWVPSLCSVDHFAPKSSSPHLAYEWSNYRLAHQKVNSYKGNSTDVLDPFHIQEGWFILDFSNCFVKPNPTTPQPVQDQVTNTIAILRLNTDETLVQSRFFIVRAYSKGRCDMDFLDECYPFIATELKRQGLRDTIKGTIA